MINDLKGSRPVCTIENLCEGFGYSRQAWYNHLKSANQRTLKRHIVLQRIREVREELPETGCMKLYKDLNAGFLQRLGLTMGRDAVFNLMRENHMLIKVKKRSVRTTNSFHRYKIYPDLVKRSAAKSAERIWVCDITYLTLVTGFAYLSAFQCKQIPVYYLVTSQIIACYQRGNYYGFAKGLVRGCLGVGKANTLINPIATMSQQPMKYTPGSQLLPR